MIDRLNLTFPGEQLTLLQRVYAVQPNTILVLINGGAIDITWPKRHIPAIVEAFYPVLTLTHTQKYTHSHTHMHQLHHLWFLFTYNHCHCVHRASWVA